MSVLILFLTAFFGTLGFSLIFNAPASELLLCGLVGAIGWTLYDILLSIGTAPLFSTFIGISAVTLVSCILARIRKMPVTVFLISGIIPFVPGSGIYYTMYYIITGDSAAAAANGVQTFKTAGIIGLGIMVSLSLPGRLILATQHENRNAR